MTSSDPTSFFGTNPNSQPAEPETPAVVIYTDGGCNPNPGPGGWGAVLLFADQPPQELCGAEPKTTNNQMELRAAIEALEALAVPHQVEIRTDSKYVKQGITEWLPKWQASNWQRGKTEVKNKDLWQKLAKEAGYHRITWQWVKGHAGNKWNERADELASSMIPKSELPLDDETAVHIFTAGSYLGKSKTGGWGVILKYRDTEKSLTGAIANTSANRMHIQSAIEGLLALKKPLPIHLYTSSDYLKDGATQWVKGWQARNWQTKEGKAVSHRDLWEKLLNLTQQLQVQWHVVSKETMPPQMKQAKELSSQAARQE